MLREWGSAHNGEHNSAIVNGDIVLIGSASQLAREGLVGYVDSLLEAANRVRLNSRRECVVLPAPFILLGGSTNPPPLCKGLVGFSCLDKNEWAGSGWDAQ
jgi:hypothetical protein